MVINLNIQALLQFNKPFISLLIILITIASYQCMLMGVFAVSSET
jgi:hypothetical protein